MGTRLFELLRALFFSVLFVSLWTYFFPRWFAAGKGVALTFEPGPVAIVLMRIGGTVMVACVWEFWWTGRGTPMPLDPPRKLVVKGLYRWVRNPMYLGMALFLVGEALALPAITREMLTLLAVLAVAVNVFILAYEEPTLRRLFGADYAAYCANVRRWLPRLTPFDNNSAAAVPSADLD